MAGREEEPTLKMEQVLIDNLDLCKMLGVKSGTWRRRVERGVSPLPFTVMGARTYYRLADVRHFLQKGTWPARMKFRGFAPDPEAEELSPTASRGRSGGRARNQRPSSSRRRRSPRLWAWRTRRRSIPGSPEGRSP